MTRIVPSRSLQLDFEMGWWRTWLGRFWLASPAWLLFLNDLLNPAVSGRGTCPNVIGEGARR